MIRLTLILALVILAVLVLVPQEREGDAPGPTRSEPPSTPGPAPQDGRTADTDDALREMADGRLVLVTATGEELAIDLVVQPTDLAAGEPGGEAAGDGPSAEATGAPEPPAPDADSGGQPTETATTDNGAPRLRVTGDRVNFRAGPSTEDEILAALALGTEVELIERVADGWVHLRVPATGLTGYMSGDFLEPAN
jgi:hypothetical protein